MTPTNSPIKKMAAHLTREVISFANRIMALGPGEYLIKLNKTTRQSMTWQVIDLDRVKEERP